MSTAQTIPVLVGVGQVLQRLDDPREAAEPLAMMLAALEQAGDDAAAGAAPARGFDLRGARDLALRRSRARDRAPARRGAGGDRRHAVRRQLLAGLRDRRGARDPGGAPRGRAGRRRGERSQRRAGPAPGRRAARDRGARRPRSQGRRGQGDLPRGRARARDEQRERRLRGDRERDPLRARREPRGPRRGASPSCGRASARSPAATRTPGSASRYSRRGDRPGLARQPDDLVSLHAADERQRRAWTWARGSSSARSRSRAAPACPTEKLVFLHAATEANDSNFLSTRDGLPPLARDAHRGSARARARGQEPSSEIDHFDLYSCFPSVGAGRRGGARHSRGPPAHRHRRAHVRRRTAQQLRAPRGRAHGRGRARQTAARWGWSTATAAGSPSTPSASTRAEPPAHGFRYENLQPQVDAFPLREALVDWEGPVTVEAYTVAHQKGAPRIAHVACLTDDGPPHAGRRSTIPRAGGDDARGVLRPARALDGHGRLARTLSSRGWHGFRRRQGPRRGGPRAGSAHPGDFGVYSLPSSCSVEVVDCATESGL